MYLWPNNVFLPSTQSCRRTASSKTEPEPVGVLFGDPQSGGKNPRLVFAFLVGRAQRIIAKLRDVNSGTVCVWYVHGATLTGPVSVRNGQEFS